MESETPSPAVVNKFGEINAEGETLPPEVFPSEIPVDLLDITRRFNRYIEGTFANGKLYERMRDARVKFQKATGFSWDHVDRMSRVFMRWSTAYKFSRERHGRSTFIYIRPKRRPLVLSTAEVRRRLVGAIRNTVARWGSAHIDRKFLENFHSLTGLPPEQITHAWRTIKFVEGCKCRWKGGTGRGANLYVEGRPHGEVSLRQKRRGISPLRGKDMKTAAWPHEPDHQTDRAFGVASPEPLAKTGESIAHRSGSPGGEADSKPSGMPAGEGSPAKPPLVPRANHRWIPVRAPLQVCDRWVSAARLDRKVFWLVFNPLQTLTLAVAAVEWVPGYAVNFCREALEMGFLDSEICAAWQVGLEETKVSAARDFAKIEEKRDRSGWVSEEWRPRALSQTVARAWLRLRSDERSDEERWRAIFAGEVKPAAEKLKAPRAAPRAETGAERSSVTARAAGTPATSHGSGRAGSGAGGSVRGEFRTIAPGLRVRIEGENPAGEWEKKKAAVRKLPDLTPALARASMGEAATFESYLKTRGMALADVLKLPRAAQQNFVREMHAWQKARSEKRPPAPGEDTQNPLL